jgi:hypothetical protein
MPLSDAGMMQQPFFTYSTPPQLFIEYEPAIRTYFRIYKFVRI